MPLRFPYRRPVTTFRGTRSERAPVLPSAAARFANARREDRIESRKVAAIDSRVIGSARSSAHSARRSSRASKSILLCDECEPLVGRGRGGSGARSAGETGRMEGAGDRSATIEESERGRKEGSEEAGKEGSERGREREAARERGKCGAKEKEIQNTPADRDGQRTSRRGITGINTSRNYRARGIYTRRGCVRAYG